MYSLRSGLKTVWIDSDLPDNTVGRRSEWFYIADQLSGLPRCTVHKPVKISEWDLGLSSRDLKDLKGVLELVSDMKKRGVEGVVVARSFCQWLIQPIKDRLQPTYEYWGQSDPTREFSHKVSKEEMQLKYPRLLFEGEHKEVPEGTLAKEAG
jgi:hypothetical protein